MFRVSVSARVMASFVISWKTIRRTGTFGFSTSHQMPGDRLAFAVLVRREQELVRVGEPLLQVGDDLLLPGVDDVVGLEAVLDVHAERAEPLPLGFRHVLRAIGQVADVADAGADRVVVAEVARDRACLRG